MKTWYIPLSFPLLFKFFVLVLMRVVVFLLPLNTDSYRLRIILPFTDYNNWHQITRLISLHISVCVKCSRSKDYYIS